MTISDKIPLTTERFTSQISPQSLRSEMENVSSRYHFIAAWVGIIFDPFFAITDYYNIPNSWKTLLVIRLSVSSLTVLTLIVRKKLQLPSYFLILVPFLLISLQNAYTYNLIGADDLLGHNLNYMALLIGASMLAMWEVTYSMIVLFVSGIVSMFFIIQTPLFTPQEFFVKGGLLLLATAVFMTILIKTRYDLTLREIKSRLALQLSNVEIQHQYKELIRQQDIINRINENLEVLVKDRTRELERKNKALEEYAFINAHKLRAPLASILGLIYLMNRLPRDEEVNGLMIHLEKSAEQLDQVVSSITKAIERGDAT